ncbi:MAG: MATE family efflux transporter [Muribaculaceae bacterium]|nr:MATE family efflux transporter [Muribaculaceae bacterium]
MADISQIQSGEPLSFRRQLALTAKLSVPAIIAQLSTILMQYIDAAMVGRLGADAAASVGLMNSSLWMFWGVCSTITMGFSVQVAHRLGARDNSGARTVLRQGIVASALAGLILALIGVAIARPLPVWLGGDPEICGGASLYFAIFVGALPVLAMNYLGGGMLRCAGNMKVPGLLSVAMCVLDVVFNFFLIFPTREISLGGITMTMPGCGLGILGAATGTVAAECLCAGATMYWLCRRQEGLNLLGAEARKSYRPTRQVLHRAARIAVPMTVEHIVFCGAQITITIIVAPLGVVAIAANAFAVTAESLCYMPGFGIGEAATTLCGQSYGAGRYDLVRRFAHLTTGLGMLVMAVMGVIMYVFAEQVMASMTPVPEIAALGAEVLRIEAWAEPMYAASIVAYGAFVGVGDTLIPASMNFGSIWLVRIPLAAILAPTMGLRGVWVAMCAELTFRGLIFLVRMRFGKWLKPGRTPEAASPVEEVA